MSVQYVNAKLYGMRKDLCFCGIHMENNSHEFILGIVLKINCDSSIAVRDLFTNFHL